mmetsp:Transcript_25150/g.42082  ORF Transcript_25150/g.42082 Transcript_25150/m.42082 type:complete len:216 (-) Transcript_25150:335-982(-)
MLSSLRLGARSVLRLHATSNALYHGNIQICSTAIAQRVATTTAATTSSVSGNVRRAYGAQGSVPPSDAHEGALLPPGKLYYACAALAIAYLGWHIVPLIGHGTAKHAIDLAMNSKDSFMQKSAAQRLGFLAQNGTVAEKLVKEGAVPATMRLLSFNPEDTLLVEGAAAALLALAGCESGKVVMREAAVVAGLRAALLASSDEPTREKLRALLQIG